MPFYLTYTMSSGAGRRETFSRGEAASAYAQLRLAGATIHAVVDQTGKVFELVDLLPDPMALAEIAGLSDRIRLLEDRLKANRSGQLLGKEVDMDLLRFELERLRAQLARVMDAYRYQ